MRMEISAAVAAAMVLAACGGPEGAQVEQVTSAATCRDTANWCECFTTAEEQLYTSKSPLRPACGATRNEEVASADAECRSASGHSDCHCICYFPAATPPPG